jgi:uncharacterized protein YceK
MKTRILLSLSLAALASGCASVSTPQASFDRTDRTYMDRVERAARAPRVQVVWVNPPQSKTPQPAQ